MSTLRFAIGGPDSVILAVAPGRVNLIGDHTDYQLGFGLPMAIDRHVMIAFRSRADMSVRVRSHELAGTLEVGADGSADPASVSPEWGRIVAAALSVLAERGRAPVGFDAEVMSSVPVGSGLSSSAALGVAITMAAARVAALPLAGHELALAAQAVEHRATGVPCGVMDQMASVFGVADHALLLDCRALTVVPIAIPSGVAVVVAHSGVPRRLADSEYAARRAACERAARRLGVATLRDATPADVRDDPIARHVVSENARVLAFADALEANDRRGAGRVMLESHASLRDDFGVSTPELDALVDRFMGAGALGARLTGAGFGGCVVALGTQDSAHAIADAVGGWIMRASPGARIVDEDQQLMPTIFSRIIAGELPGRFVWKDDQVVAFLSIAPMMPGHTLVVPRDEVDHWIDLDPALAAHLFSVAQQIGRAQQLEWNPARVGVLIVGEEVPHTHIHVVPINSPNELSFAHIDPAPDAGALDDIALRLRERLRELGAAGVSD